MLLAVSTWALSKAITPDLPDELRAELLLSVRICCPGLFAVAVAFFVPTFDRFFQIAMVSINYIALVSFIPMYMPSLSENPIICVVSAITSLFAFLPNVHHDEGFIHHTRRILLGLMFSIILPIFTATSITLILRQMNVYVLFTFDEIFGRSLLSGIYVPVYLTLQAMGFQDIVSDLVSMSYQNNMVTAFVNTVIVTNMLSLPAALFSRSMFARYHTRLFMALLVVITVLASSIGACVSLTWLIIFVFYPGTFGILMLSSVICFSISYAMRVAPITSVNNLYMPDVNLSYTTLFYSAQITFLELFAIILPIAVVTLCMTIKRDRSKRRRNKKRSVDFGYSVKATSTPELKLIAFLRALGGVSNIMDVEEDGSWLYVQVIDRDESSHLALNALFRKKILVDRVNRLYLCNIGPDSHFYYTRLSQLIENLFEEEEYKVPLSAPFTLEDFRRVDHKHTAAEMEEQEALIPFGGTHVPFHSYWGPHGPHIYQTPSSPSLNRPYTHMVRPKRQASAFQTATAAPMSAYRPRTALSTSGIKKPAHRHHFVYHVPTVSKEYQALAEEAVRITSSAADAVNTEYLTPHTQATHAKSGSGFHPEDAAWWEGSHSLHEEDDYDLAPVQHFEEAEWSVTGYNTHVEDADADDLSDYDAWSQARYAALMLEDDDLEHSDHLDLEAKKECDRLVDLAIQRDELNSMSAKSQDETEESDTWSQARNAALDAEDEDDLGDGSWDYAENLDVVSLAKQDHRHDYDDDDLDDIKDEEDVWRPYREAASSLEGVVLNDDSDDYDYDDTSESYRLYGLARQQKANFHSDATEEYESIDAWSKNHHAQRMQEEFERDLERAASSENPNVLSQDMQSDEELSEAAEHAAKASWSWDSQVEYEDDDSLESSEDHDANAPWGWSGQYNYRKEVVSAAPVEQAEKAALDWANEVKHGQEDDAAVNTSQESLTQVEATSQAAASTKLSKRVDSE